MTVAHSLPVTPESHVVDILGSTRGRDQPIMLVEKAISLVSCVDDDVFNARDTIIFDPFCKAGEVLVAAALLSCTSAARRLAPLASTESIMNELYKGRYYGLAPDERHYLLSLRTFYGNDRSHDPSFTRHICKGSYLSEIDGRLNEATFKEEFRTMIQFIRNASPTGKIVAIGNPPYQEADGGARASARPIYNFFVEQLMDCGEVDEFSIVIPARWFAGGKNLDEFRKKLATCGQVRQLKYFDRAEDVFPTVHIQGGVCFVNWKRSHQGGVKFFYRDSVYDRDLAQFDIIPDDPAAAEIVEKVLKSGVKKFVSESAWSRKPFGLSTDYFRKNKEAEGVGAVKCLVKGKKTKSVLREHIKVHADKIDTWKVAIPGAYATGARRCTLPRHQFFLIKKGEIATETYNVVDCFDTKEEAERFIAYLQTDFVRYLLGVRKLTQHIPKDRWSWVPYMDTGKTWTDEQLFAFFDLTKKEQEHIKKKVQEWS